MTAPTILSFLVLSTVAIERHDFPGHPLAVSAAELGEDLGRPELVLRHTEDSVTPLGVNFVLYDSGVVIVDDRHWADPADYRIGRIARAELGAFRKFISPPAAFFVLPPRIAAGHIRDGPSFEITAGRSDRYKAVRVTGLLEGHDGAAPIFVPEIDTARSEAPSAFLQVLDRILRLRVDGARGITPRHFRLHVSEHRREFGDTGCPWPSEWPRPVQGTRDYSGGIRDHVIPHYIVEMSTPMWPRYLELRTNCRGQPLILDDQAYFVKASISLPGEEVWSSR